jgi:hypothetical protein
MHNMNAKNSNFPPEIVAWIDEIAGFYDYPSDARRALEEGVRLLASRCAEQGLKIEDQLQEIGAQERELFQKRLRNRIARHPRLLKFVFDFTPVCRIGHGPGLPAIQAEQYYSKLSAWR